MSKRILIVGCGQLGSRHLQAVASVKGVSHIQVVDPSSVGLALGQARLKEVAGIEAGIHFDWSSDVHQAGSCDLCIVATQAAGRGALVKQITEQTGCRKFLLEKIVAQSVEEYKELMDFMQAQGCGAWVNCKTRAYKIHRYIKQKIADATPLLMSIVGGNHGLANNGVHAADLFAFYEGGSRIDPVVCRVDQKLHPSKRGAAIFDLSGTLMGKTVKGSELILSFAKDHVSLDTISINTPACRFWVDHFQQLYFESYPDDGWAWRKIEMPENIMVSSMTKTFVSDILSHGQCQLPTLEECFIGHEFILNALMDPFSRLLGRQVNVCPVT